MQKLFKIEHIKSDTKELNYVKLSNSDNSSYAKISLNLGGSLQALNLNQKSIIKDNNTLSYNDSYASAILFPFTNRIQNGTYTFQNKEYVLDLNLKEENNALHGLVYNKEFTIVKEQEEANYASVTLEFNETQNTKGFPFKYSILITYKLIFDAINIEVVVKNIDRKSFPFNIGWHPYFWSRNLHDSFLTIKSDKKIVFDKEMIPIKIENISAPKIIQIKNKTFDDCYILNNNSVSFKTPEYNILINSSSDENYLQVYTPSIKNNIAIEPKTGPANSFNNKLGLQVLNPNEIYNINWKIKLI
ncbi:MAG: aldose 1-epimerase [Lutibacter sp.]|nr:MAG: aldose 1-epimerase [Lutibacter sp.]